MEDHYLRTLELNKVLDRLAGHTAFSVSREMALGVRPTSDLREVLRRQAATAEARRLLDLKPNFTIGGARDVRPLLQRAAVGALLSPDELLMIATTTAASRYVRGHISKLEEQLPTLEEITLPIGNHDEIEQEIHRAISDTGEVVDAASPALATVRIELRRAHERLMAKLNEITTSAAYRSALQEPIVTERQGRYVVPVKAEFKGQFKGIVHDQSASGATVFMEPLAVVDLANRVRQLQLEERQEIERILRSLSGIVGRDSERSSRHTRGPCGDRPLPGRREAGRGDEGCDSSPAGAGTWTGSSRIRRRGGGQRGRGCGEAADPGTRTPRWTGLGSFTWSMPAIPF